MEAGIKTRRAALLRSTTKGMGGAPLGSGIRAEMLSTSIIPLPTNPVATHCLGLLLRSYHRRVTVESDVDHVSRDGGDRVLVALA